MEISMSPSPADAADSAAARLEAAAREAAAMADELLAADAVAGVSDQAVQELLAAGTRLFARKVELERRYFAPVSASDAVTPTEAAIMVTELLRTVNLNLFDLSMWAGRPRGDAEDGQRLPGA
jgi:hypothetical protein